ncbi:hypothetical protein [Plastoroseomonas hellenica]|uniref:Uncharacterized protein n=1 Tax=Plastoroseomonas hellenica TaxID=2687306 RepID=A0ABS5F1U4_9PROT|nr:hypothetical protein [Plastoroseomonas hellenica]MBR0641682.1 hypothetical protein [Plastoroseomonas hellenica]MBR0666443.1 hypothetical protein [Plastoroseomonas hellenica]
MELDVFRSAGAELERVGTCDIRYFSSKFFEVLHQPEAVEPGPRRPMEAHGFAVIDLRDECGTRTGLLAQDQANPSVLPGWRAA